MCQVVIREPGKISEANLLIFLQTFYQPITVLGPALAIDQVAGFNYIISAAAIFFVCIGYSSLVFFLQKTW